MTSAASWRLFISFPKEAVRLISYFLFWYNNTERIFTRNIHQEEL